MSGVAPSHIAPLKPRSPHPPRLTRRELFETVVIAVIHEVVYGVQAWMVRARVPANGAPIRRYILHRCVVNRVPWLGAALTLKGVLEIEPMADLVGGRFPLIVRGERAARQAGGDDAAAVNGGQEIVLPLWGLGEEAEAERREFRVAEARLDPDIECVVTSLAGGLADGHPVFKEHVRCCPLRVDVPPRVHQVEFDSMRLEACVHDVELLLCEVRLGRISASLRELVSVRIQALPRCTRPR